MEAKLNIKGVKRSYIYVKQLSGNEYIKYLPYEVCKELFETKLAFSYIRERILFMAIGNEFSDNTAEDLKIFRQNPEKVIIGGEKPYLLA